MTKSHPRHIVSLSRIAVVVETMPTNLGRLQIGRHRLRAPAMRAERLG
jgi:hypothetical protein